MALVHYFLPLSLDVSGKLAKYQKEYVIDGSLERYECLEDVPKPIDNAIDATAGDILMEFYMSNKNHAISVQDKYICKNLLKFRTVETFFIGFIPCIGLNYYGFTVIPHESLQEFINILKRNSVRNCYSELIFLCQEAYKLKCDILHCGI